MKRNVAPLAEPADRTLSRIGKLLRLLREAGLEHAALDLPVNNRRLRYRLAKFWNNGCYDPMESLRFSLKLQDSESDLTNYVPVYVPDMSIMDMVRLMPDRFAFCSEGEEFDKKHWYEDEIFANEGEEPGWHLVNRNGGSNTARVLVWASLAFAAQTGQKFLIIEQGCTRTQNFAENGQMVGIQDKVGILLSRFGLANGAI